MCMKTSMSTFWESRPERFLLTLFPAVLNTRSTGAFVAGMQNNLQTLISRAGQPVISNTF